MLNVEGGKGAEEKCWSGEGRVHLEHLQVASLSSGSGLRKDTHQNADLPDHGHQAFDINAF